MTDAGWVRFSPDLDESLTPDDEAAWGRLFMILEFVRALTDELESDDDE